MALQRLGVRQLGIKLSRNVMNMNRLTVDDGSPTHMSSVDRTRLTNVVGRSHVSIRGTPTKNVPLKAIDLGVRCFAKPGRALGHRVQHRLNIGWRAGDHAQNLASRRLLLRALSNLPRLGGDRLL